MFSLPLFLNGFGPLLWAARYTLLISGLGILLSLVVGAFICAAALSRPAWLRRAAAVYVSFLRGVPLLVLLLLVYYLLPVIGINVPKLVAAVFSVGICSSAYVSEYWRGAIISLPKGQAEAAMAVGMSPLSIWTRIILPQAARISVPSLVNEAILLVKASSLVLVIGIMEITRAAQGQASITYRPLEAYLAAAVVYLVINLALAGLGRFLEHRMNV